MTLLADLVAASNEVAATSSRSRKIAVLADLLQRLELGEVPIAAGLVSGLPRQGRVGVGFAAVYGVEQIPTTDVFSNGQMVKRITGAKPKDDMLHELAEFI